MNGSSSGLRGSNEEPASPETPVAVKTRRQSTNQVRVGVRWAEFHSLSVVKVNDKTELQVNVEGLLPAAEGMTLRLSGL